MIQLILISHGSLGLALIETSQLLYGQAEAITSLSLPPEKSTESFREELNAELKRGFKETLILTDLEGGTPCNQALMETIQRKGTEVLSGMNLPMLLEALSCREQLPLSELSSHLIDSARKGIVNSTLKLQAHQAARDDTDELEL